MTPWATGALQFLFFGFGRGHALWTLPVYVVPVRCSVSVVHCCMGTIYRPVWSCQSSMVCPSFLSGGVAGSHLTQTLSRWFFPMTRYRWLTLPAPHIHAEGPAAVSNSKGICT